MQSATQPLRNQARPLTRPRKKSAPPPPGERSFSALQKWADVDADQFVTIPDAVSERRGLSNAAKLVYGLIAYYQRHHSQFPDTQTIAAMTGSTRKTAQRAISELNDEGLLKDLHPRTKK